jgi:hypothetical protein
MRALALLTVVGLLAAAAAASTMKLLAAAERATASLQPVTISVQELHRQVDVKSLPESKIANLY